MSFRRNCSNPCRHPELERLESRQHFAAHFSLFPTANGFIGPIYVAPKVPKATDSAAVVRRVVSTHSDQVAVVDLTFSDNHPQFERGWWCGLAPWSDPATKTPNGSQERIQQFASYAAKGGVAPWGTQVVRQNAFTVLDFEHSFFADQTPEYLAQRVRWFKQAAPDAPMTMFGINIENGPFNRDTLSNPTPEQYNTLKAHIALFRPLVNELTAVDVCCYMLGPAAVERDFKALITVARAMREVYPDKPIVGTAWGMYMYSTAQPPPNWTMPDVVMKRYVDLLRTYFDGILVWGRASENARLLDMLSNPENRKRLPKPPINLPVSPVVVGSGDVSADTVGGGMIDVVA